MSDHHPDCSGWTFDYGGPFDCPGAPACEAIRDGEVVQLVDEVVPLNNLAEAPPEKDGSAGQSVGQVRLTPEDIVRRLEPLPALGVPQVDLDALDAFLEREADELAACIKGGTWSELRFVWCPSPPRPAGGGECR